MVLSTMSGMPASLAISPSASRSEMTPPGLARLSQKIALQFGVSAFFLFGLVVLGFLVVWALRKRQ